MVDEPEVLSRDREETRIIRAPPGYEDGQYESVEDYDDIELYGDENGHGEIVEDVDVGGGQVHSSIDDVRGDND